jgi:5-(aminomethyl)-3-furanmethanol phosphate kinase
MPFYVLKLGGSLMESSRGLVRALADLAEEGYSFLVVPGGGPMADLVRDLFMRHKISQEAAHWMAILAMEQYAYFLADNTGARLVEDIRKPNYGSSGGVEILLPYQSLKRDDMGLEHNWDYTSDSVAALVALRLNSPLIKATNVDGVIIEGKVQEVVFANHLIGIESCIDQGTLRLITQKCKGSSLRILNGTDSSAFISALKSGKGGTVIISQ